MTSRSALAVEEYHWIMYTDHDGVHGPVISNYDPAYKDWWVCGSDVPLDRIQVEKICPVLPPQQEQGTCERPAASGGEVVWIHVDDLAVLADPDERNDTPAFASLNDVDAEYQAGMVPFYRTPPAAVPADALERLVEKWQYEVSRGSTLDMDYKDTLKMCIGQLTALIPKGEQS